VLAARVHFPSNSLSPVVRQATPDTIWVQKAPEGLCTEVAIFLINIAGNVIDWPGKNGGAQLVGRLQIEGGGQVCIVHRVTSAWPALPVGRALTTYFRGKSDVDLPEANRAVAWGEEPDGSISFVEISLTNQRTGAA
jgi:hypothetical protein